VSPQSVRGPKASRRSRQAATGVADGRMARGERTRRALAEATIALIEEGDEAPTARRIAERAGVSLRLVFHHFEDVESVLRAAVAVQAERHWSHIEPVPATGELEERVRRIVAQRADLYGAIGQVRRVAAAIERNSPTVSAELARSRSLLRAQLRTTFSPELESCDGGSKQSARRLLDALDSATSFETWDVLLRMGRSAAETRRVVEALAEGALGLLSSRPGPSKQDATSTKNGGPRR
jgi:AcrR family transcriptional regulator